MWRPLASQQPPSRADQWKSGHRRHADADLGRLASSTSHEDRISLVRIEAARVQSVFAILESLPVLACNALICPKFAFCSLGIAEPTVVGVTARRRGVGGTQSCAQLAATAGVALTTSAGAHDTEVEAVATVARAGCAAAVQGTADRCREKHAPSTL